MTWAPERWTGSRWAVAPQTTPTRDRHDCRGDDCRTCNAAISAAEDDREFGDHGDDMDERAEREFGGAW